MLVWTIKLKHVIYAAAGIQQMCTSVRRCAHDALSLRHLQRHQVHTPPILIFSILVLSLIANRLACRYQQHIPEGCQA